MADVNDVLERLISDPGFRRALSEDPEKALAGYDLTKADLEMLAAHVSDDPGARGGMEQRTSKSALAGLFGGASSGGESDLGFISRLAENEEDDTHPTESLSLNFEPMKDTDLLEEEVAFAYKTIKFEEGETLAPLQQDSAGGDHEIEMDVHVGRSEPEAPSDLTAGGDTDEGSTGVDATGKTFSGEYVVTSLQHSPSQAEGEALGEETSGATSSKPKEIVVVGSPPPPPAGGENSSNWIRVRGDWSEPDHPSDITAGRDTEDGALGVDGMVGGQTSEGDYHRVELENVAVTSFETSPLEGLEDGTSKTMAVSESTPGSEGDPLVGKITPKGETEQTTPELAESIGEGEVNPGHEETIDLLSYSQGATDDPDQPVIAGRVYNDADSTDRTEDGPVGESKSGPSARAGLRSDGELVQDDEGGPGDLAANQPEAEEASKGNVKAGYDLKVNKKA